MDRRAVVGSIGKLKVALAVFSVLVASVGGAFALGVVGAPAVTGVTNRFGPVNNETTVIETDLTVDNPNPIGVQLGGTTVNYTVNMNDVEMATGQKEGLDVASGNSTLEFSTDMDNTRIPDWWVTHIRNGEKTNVTIDANVETSLLGHRDFALEQHRQIETNIIGSFASTESRPVNANQPLVSDPVLFINETSAEWGEVTEAETPIPMKFVVFNPKTEPYTITEVGYDITMNGIPVGNGTTDQTYVIPGGATETLRTTPTIRNDRLDDWWVSHLENDQVTQLKIDFYARVELPTGNEIRVPLDQLTYTRTIETDIFGTKDEPASDGSAGSSSTGGDRTTSTPVGTSTPADGDGGTDVTATPTDGTGAGTPTPTPLGGDTPAPSPSATPTAEPTPTPTDGGGLIDLGNG